MIRELEATPQELLIGAMDDLGPLLKALFHPRRFTILTHLLSGPMVFQTLKSAIGLKKSALANHLRVLLDHALIEKVRHGTYELTADGRRYIEAFAAAYRASERQQRQREELQQRFESTRAFLQRHRHDRP